jgi:hypothetical protein
MFYANSWRLKLRLLKHYCNCADTSLDYKYVIDIIFLLYQKKIGGPMLFAFQRALIHVFRRACENNHERLVWIILSLRFHRPTYRFDLNKRDEAGDSPLMKAVVKKHFNIVEILLNCGIDPNIRNNRNYSPLMIAAFNENLEIVELLMARGADVRFRSYDGTTAEEFANWSGNHDIAKMVRLVPELN